MNKRLYVSPDEREKLIERYLNGEKVISISKDMNIGTSSIYKILREYDVLEKVCNPAYGKITVSLDKEAFIILKEINPRNVSRFVSSLIKNYKNTRECEG